MHTHTTHLQNTKRDVYCSYNNWHRNRQKHFMILKCYTSVMAKLTLDQEADARRDQQRACLHSEAEADNRPDAHLCHPQCKSS